MRVIIFTLILNISIFAFSFYTDNYLAKSSVEMIATLKTIENNLENENWQMAQKSMQNFEQKWKDNLFMWSLITDHSEIDNIEVSIAHIKSYLKTQDFSEVNAEIASLFRYIKHIPENEKLTIRNIF
ncbi:protein of unknown function [Desulfonispora thiosulfatigenes DSM 11270]|uniref:DUF4363 family protein n=1 Tax=Desulfonispora thiosulfatigenes DSM 11270 TaxID=656914 RepID=A0A1W1UKT1_DESTI|nr:DUF4363 family protein [Desulfonispora thiosulfatigenes]SMB81682.1 protein of unknown function [Desulfonispora thiosulfatigenes DSM 11270]